MHMGMAYFLSYMTLLVSIIISICRCLQLYADWGNTKLLLLPAHPFIKDTFSAETLTLSTSGLNDVFEHLDVHVYIFLDSGDGTQQVKIRYL